MSAPVEYTLGQRAFRWLGPVLIASGITLWGGIPFWRSMKTGAMYVRQTGGPLPLDIYGGVAMTILGGILLMQKGGLRGDPSDPAMERYLHHMRVLGGGKPSTARVVAIHSKSTLFGPWVEVYVTLKVRKPSRTIKTTVILNRQDLPKLQPGETVPTRADREDGDEIAVKL